ncbi:MAG: ABC-F family ATP-binding cassette domain-containing protein [Pseudonocardiales bacterium]
MSATLQAVNLAAGHGARALFSGLSLVIAPGDVVGLVGGNGAGKSTLLRMLAGEVDPEQGSIVLSPPTATVGHLPQEPDRRPGEAVLDFLGRRTGVSAAREAMDAAADALVGDDAAAHDRYADALERWLSLGGADFNERAGLVAASVGLGVDLMAPTTALSGGQVARAALAALLLSRYDIVLLDEPTNDLDLDGLDRLERFVQGLRSPAVIVSHDREFLARTVSQIVELDLAQQHVGVYAGGYDSYLAEREVACRHARESFEVYADKLGELKDRAQTQRNWMAQGVRNARRKSTDNDKIGRNRRLETSENQAAKARQTQRLIERMEVVEEPRKEWDLQMSVAAAPRSGTVVASMSRAVVHRGLFTLGPIDAQVNWADRIALTGANGAGKTTLLSVLLGRIPVDGGSARLGANVRVGEIDQARERFLGPQSLSRSFRDAVPDWPEAEVRTLLAKFGLGGQHATRAAQSLSPGERTRAALALLQAREVNLLVLDEPTNHLDLPAIEQLEQALDSFGGTVVLITHDRRMLDTVRMTRRWELTSGRLTER